jgi:DNA-binding response OmpR family regulator
VVRCVLVSEAPSRLADLCRIAEEAGVEFRLSTNLDTRHIAFALRNRAVIVIASAQDAVGSLLRAQGYGYDGPILMLSPSPIEIARGNSQAQDDVVWARWPVSAKRLKALVRRLYDANHQECDCPVWFDLAAHEVGVSDDAIRLSRREFGILRCLVEHAGRPVEAPKLRIYAWGANTVTDSEVVTVAVSRLRKKLARIGLRKALVTVRGVGFAFRLQRRDSR